MWATISGFTSPKWCRLNSSKNKRPNKKRDKKNNPVVPLFSFLAWPWHSQVIQTNRHRQKRIGLQNKKSWFIWRSPKHHPTGVFHKNIQKQQSNKMLGICWNGTCQCSSSLNDPIVLFALAYLTTNDASMPCVCSIATCRRSPAITLLDFGWDSGLVESIHQPSFSLYRFTQTKSLMHPVAYIDPQMKLPFYHFFSFNTGIITSLHSAQTRWISLNFYGTAFCDIPSLSWPKDWLQPIVHERLLQNHHGQCLRLGFSLLWRTWAESLWVTLPKTNGN